MLRRDRHAIAVFDGQTLQVHSREGSLETLQHLGGALTVGHGGREALRQVQRERLIHDGEHHAAVPEGRFLLVGRLQQDRYDGCHPSLAVYHFGHPAQLLHRLQHTPCIEDGPERIVLVLLPLLVCHGKTLVEEVLVVDEIHLHACRGNGRHLDDERVVSVIDDEVHAREADNLMELVPAFVDIAPLGSERTYLTSMFLDVL